MRVQQTVQKDHSQPSVSVDLNYIVKPVKERRLTTSTGEAEAVGIVALVQFEYNGLHIARISPRLLFKYNDLQL